MVCTGCLLLVVAIPLQGDAGGVITIIFSEQLYLC